jgi:hypothetical protein
MRAVTYGLNDRSASCPLYAGSDDGKLYQLLTESTSTASMHRVVPGAIPVSCVSSLEGAGLIAAGDDEGGVHLFDFRESSEAPATSVLEQADYISSIHIFKESSLAVASGDGTLAVYDLRMPPKAKIKLVAATPSYEDDLLSLTMFGAGLAVGGTLAGAVHVYNMKLAEADEDEPDMGRFVDRFYGHPESVSAILPFESEGIVLTGSSDGLVRVVEPRKKLFLGVLPFVDLGSACSIYADGLSRHQLDEGEDDTDDDDDDNGDDDGDDDEEDDTEEDEDSENDGGSGEEEKGVVPSKISVNRLVRKKPILWPVEDMVFVNGMSNRRIASIGHSAFIRFCDLSILDESGESSADDRASDGRLPNHATASRGKQGRKESALLPDDARARMTDGGSFKRRRKSKPGTSQADQAAFFAGL